MILKPELPRRTYLLRAGLIAAALCLAILAAIWCLEHDASLWWLLATDLVLVLACGRSLLLLLEGWNALIGSSDLFGIVLFAITPLIIPLLAPIALIWNLIQAMRAQP